VTTQLQLIILLLLNGSDCVVNSTPWPLYPSERASVFIVLAAELANAAQWLWGVNTICMCLGAPICPYSIY